MKESELSLITDVFESSEISYLSPSISDTNESIVDGTNKVLGKFEGIYFMPDGYSLNKRFYSKKLWENCLNNKSTQSLLASGMCGTLEHPTSRNIFNDSGLFTASHPIYTGIITKSLVIESRNNKLVGMGKGYIIDTEVGRAIHSLLTAKDENGNNLVRLAVSSRAFSRSSGKDKMGNEIMDENNYILKAFDVVLSPGIPQAYPQYTSFIESVRDNVLNDKKLSIEETKYRLMIELGLIK